MSGNFYSRGAEDRKQVSLQELPKVRFGIVSVRRAKRDRPAAADSSRMRSDALPGTQCN